jgi:PAS domain S-box-containing protein
MQWQSNPYFIPLIIAGLISLVNALVVAQRRSLAGSLPLLGMLLALSWWSFTYAFELASANQAWQIFWAKLEYLGIVCVPPLFLLFTLEYAQYRDVLNRKSIYWIWLIPAVTLLLVWTNDFHGLIWSEVGQKNAGDFYLLSLGHGLAFWVWTAYSYAFLLLGSYILIRRAISSPPELKPQSYILVFGAAITLIGNVIYLAGLSPIPDLDPTPITFIISMIAYSIGLFRFGILDIMPIAGETVLESLDNVVIVIDDADRIVFINQAFEYYTGADSKTFIGKHASSLSIWPGLGKLVASQAKMRGEVVMTFDGREPVYFDTRVSTVRWKSQRLGRACILEDVSERRRAEKSAFGISDESLFSNDNIPVIFVLRSQDEKIIEVNRSFILDLGYERKDVVGQSLLQLGIWDIYQRGDFLKILRSEGSVKDHSLSLVNTNREKKSYLVSAHRMDLDEDGYIVVLACPAGA